MKSSFRTHPLQTGRRKVLKQAASLGMLASGATSWTTAFGQGDELAAYKTAKINWRQTEGEAISVAVIPASYFENLISLIPQFEALTGIKVRMEKVPPGQIRQKALLDLSSKTATFATHAADPMYYPLYVANKWVDPLDTYLNDPTLTDKAWFNSSKPGAKQTLLAVSPMASRLMAKSPFRCIAKTCTQPKVLNQLKRMTNYSPMQKP